MKATARCLIVAITIFSWIAISNHCSLRALASKTDTTQSGCPFHSKPAKHQPQPAGTECCKILRAVSTTPAKSLAPSIVDLVHVDFALDAIALLPSAIISFTPATLDTGPPGRTSFVELIGSMHAHAPPVSA
ncbi:MAG TPA: hypothetical protein VNW72_03020 [Chthoniobacterales bacterium]|nr:hypothetical protein [Chthoniobacterales bacterium]